MIYWDSSALVALIVQQPSSDPVRAIYARDSQVLAWTASEIEILSALCRLHRERALDDAGFSAATARLENLWDSIDAVSAIGAVKLRARRVLRTHELRAAAALQLGAALLAASDDPVRWTFVCLDQRLADAARREGFTVLPDRVESPTATPPLSGTRT